MSATPDRTARLGANDIRARKGAEPIVCLTAYTTPMARLVDRHCDLLLVGDSLGMVVHGLPSTVGVTMEMMILHGQAVARGASHGCMVVDLPFGSYEQGREQAFRNAARLMAETGCQAVKLEGGRHMADTVAFLVQRGIPVMGHIGLTPQSVNTLGGYRVQGRGHHEAERLVADAVALADAGAFSVVLEKLPEMLGRRITQEIPVPTIGIGAGVDCDGQVLVVDDMLGLFADFRPKFVKRYAELAATAEAAITAYAAEVRARRFPGPEHSFGEGKPA
ncbi:ketopantoate hydroxymethyltransferase [Paracoccus halophilus]|uniref:3-methyl-2-oxobutanoate hydroxymethyltransferase n=1 Tax=Paracoccus halophilus TaxID=376733 RepID=A0A099F0K2_9RHOB|nr:3-methyl-2-oxobutanoate hydroxymethyltransferase [Paracoccus halophilus]KGJ04215.1 3-methyl-2-oxobutanoate hydroxymethyltransferase [Paracoccus halophilus]SFA51869.1 ketopantoate hydroxymethyltransferase [Paracoccus halophilus]